jgi:hypothetical protein
MIGEPECSKRECKWFGGIERANKTEEITERPVCSAFPKGIPDSIAYGDDKHKVVHPEQIGDHVFEKA